MKVSPKSCSCQHCLRGKRTRAGHKMMTADERSVRHKVNSDLAKLRGLDYNLCWLDEAEIVTKTVPIGNYYD